MLYSFDNIAGYWNFRPDIDGLNNIQHCNNYINPYYTIYGLPIEICAAPYEREVPIHDPDHNFAGTSYELYENWNPTNKDKPTMGGFVQRESDKYNSTPGDASFVIRAYTEKETQILAYLAQNFGFWDTYYYETDIIDAFMYEWVQDNAMDKLVHASEFFNDVANGTLPSFSYINPGRPNEAAECCTIDSMHPTSNIAAGEQLIKYVYDTLRNSKYWESTLFILNFDEHGGFADHVPPPVNVPQPDDKITFTGESDGHNVTYDFTRLGVRVPSFIISPWIPANTLIHNQGTSYAPNSAYTHSSFLHFLQLLWDLPELNNRVSWAKTFEYVFTDKIRTDTPQVLPTPQWVGGVSSTEPEPFYLLNQDYSYYADQ
ncbi:hypothetical protein DH86_00004034 [Scytalidium sp. 3C]|nr:hypothetical protein DH86_00004034 [Scytalidium sp. 3C]